MANCSPTPRTIDEGLDWFLSNNPSSSGLCANHTWRSLGGDRGCPPAWGCVNANQVYDKVIASGRYWTTPKRGDIAVWKYGNNGHAARVYNEAGTQIATTDPSNGKMVGIESIDYPSKWGATSSKRIFTDTYNGVKCFTSGASSVSHGDVYLSKLVYGQMDSDSVKRLQMHLNGHPLQNGHTIDISGNYLDKTDAEVRLCQQQHNFGNDPAKASSVGPNQAAHLFAGCACVVVKDVDETVPPVPEPPAETWSNVAIWDWYSEKFTSKVLVYPDGDWHDIDLPAQPASGITGKSKEEHFLYLRIHLSKGRSATRTIHTRFLRSNDDETAYKSPAWDAGASDSIAYENFHVEKGSGLGGRWQIMVDGGTDPIDYTTRYAKTYVTYRRP
jgi:hypothetical protein